MYLKPKVKIMTINMNFSCENQVKAQRKDCWDLRNHMHQVSHELGVVRNHSPKSSCRQGEMLCLDPPPVTAQLSVHWLPSTPPTGTSGELLAFLGSVHEPGPMKKAQVA